MVYLLVKSVDGSHIVVAKDRLEALQGELGTESAVELTEVAEIAGNNQSILSALILRANLNIIRFTVL